jgi:hypothetical protein
MSLLRFFRNNTKLISATDNKNGMTAFVTSEVEGKPRAVVLLLGFAGAKPKHIAKYADLYNRNRCSTVSGTATNYDIFSANKAGQDAMAIDAVRQVTKVLRACDASKWNDKTEIAVVMHIMSNGGSFITTRLGLMLEAAAKEDLQNKQDTEDLRLFAQSLKLGYQIFDSAPGNSTMKSSFNVIKDLIPNKFIAIPAAAAFTVVVALLDATSLVTGRRPEGEIFWNLLLNDTSCMRQAYIYSHSDEICDATKIAEMAEERKKRGVHVMTKHFEDSKHVQHLRTHEAEYLEFIATMLKDMEDRNEQ